MRKILVVSAMGLLAIGTEVASARPALNPDAQGFTYHDVQAPLTGGLSDDFQAPRAPRVAPSMLRDDAQAAQRGDELQAPLHDGEVETA